MPEKWFADTPDEALDVYIGLHRKMSPSERLARGFELGQFQHSLQVATSGPAIPRRARRRCSSVSLPGESLTELGPVFESLLAILDQLDIPYLVGGSVASGNYGLPSQTNDIEIVADFGTADLGEFRN